MTTSNTHYVIPGVLERNWEEIEKKLEIFKIFSNKVHIDVIDKAFGGEEIVLDLAPFSKYKDQLVMEIHLMVNEPINYLKTFYSVGFKRFIGQVEYMGDQAEFVARGELYGEVGLALDLDSSMEKIKVPFEDLDLVHIMSVKAGKSGQEFDQSSIEKIKNLRSKTDIPIEVDGGINDQILTQCKNAGANFFVATSFISDSQNPQEAFRTLEKLATS